MGVVGSDDFNRSDADPLDGDWARFTCFSYDFDLTSNAVRSASEGDSGVYYTGGTPNADQYVQATVTAVGGIRWHLVARATNSANGDFYHMQLRTTVVDFWRFENGSHTQIGDSVSISNSTDDVWRFEVEGSGSNTELRGYQNEELTIEETDSTGAHSSGYAGLFSYSTTVAGFDDFECGNLGSNIPIFVHHYTKNIG